MVEELQQRSCAFAITFNYQWMFLSVDILPAPHFRIVYLIQRTINDITDSKA